MLSSKKYLSLALSTVLLMSSVAIPGNMVLASTGDVAINETNFPDDFFRQGASLIYDSNSDGVLSQAELSSVTEMDDTYSEITDYTGIGYYINLEKLICSSFGVSVLDVSGNMNLKSLNCVNSYNLNALDISKNTKLMELDCHNSGIMTLDISNNKSLIEAFTKGKKSEVEPGVLMWKSGDSSLTISDCTVISINGKQEYPVVHDDTSTSTQDPTQDSTQDPTQAPAQTPTQAPSNIKSLDINTTNFPDDVFRLYVMGFDKDSNGILSEEEIKEVTELNVGGEGCKSIKGIEYFVFATDIIISGKDLKSVDLSKNTKLESVHCFSTGVESLTLGEQDYLENLNCAYSQLKTLDVSGCKRLKSLSCEANQLTSLNTNSLSFLSSLFCNANNLKSLDVTENPNLSALSCCDNELTSLDLSNNNNLYTAYCSNNKISSLKINDQAPISELGVSNMNLTTIDVSCYPELIKLECANNKLTKLDLSKNTKLDFLDCSNNNLAELNLYDYKITILNCSNNKLSALDVSSLETLNELRCAQNELTTLDVSNLKNLETLDCADNKLASIDVSKNNNLSFLLVSGNLLTSLDVTNNTKLMGLYCSNNKISNIQFNDKIYDSLYYLDIENNSITSINAAKFPYLNDLYCSGTKLSKLDISNYKSLHNLRCANLGISELDISNNPEIYYLDCSNNKLTKLDTTYLTNIAVLNCSSNQLTELDVAGKTGIWKLDCHNNNLTELKLDNPGLSMLSVYGNKISSIILCETAFSDSNWINNSADGGSNGKIITYETSKVYCLADNVPSNMESEADSITLDDGKKVSCVSWFLAFDKSTSLFGVGIELPGGKSSSVDGFAERLYTTCLGRDAEEAGKDYWVTVLKSGKTGAEVAENFFFSEEMNNRNLSDKEYINSLYETFMGRTPADAEVEYWASEMKSGKDRKFIFYGFVNSPEWADICLAFGIRSGGLAESTYEKTPSKTVKAFIERLYTSCLGRPSDDSGLNYWATELVNLRQTGTAVAYGFFFSPEFQELNTDNKEFVTLLYGTFMDRNPDEAGFNYWVGELNNGKSREEVFTNFSVAQEFANLCAEAGILR